MKLCINLITAFFVLFSPPIYSFENNCENTIKKIKSLYQLSPLEFEGGYFKRTYTLKNNNNDSLQATAIMYLLTKNDKSILHKLGSDEIYHFYTGDPVNMLLLNDNGTTRKITLGIDVLHGQQVQVVVSKNSWQGSSLSAGGCFALLGTTMTPGFNFKTFKNGDRKELMKKYPKEAKNIIYLTL